MNKSESGKKVACQDFGEEKGECYARWRRHSNINALVPTCFFTDNIGRCYNRKGQRLHLFKIRLKMKRLCSKNGEVSAPVRTNTGYMYDIRWVFTNLNIVLFD
jgi:hypothetical protein